MEWNGFSHNHPSFAYSRVTLQLRLGKTDRSSFPRNSHLLSQHSRAATTSKPKADVNEKATSGNTALHAAVNTGNISMVQTLINAGVKVNACNAECEGATPLHLAVMGGDSEMVSVLLQAGCDKNAKMGTPATITPLNLATELGLKDIICLLS
ncbi:putative ankyrin repeat protein RF_0381 [Acropora muricata]|uniref:putative ankyrin repeat protein RF_0381 n=1 Tax=Acropora muricata TaxID=159855 RepID=UPI0034E50C8E